MTMAKPPQKGAVTHHQDQLITLQSLSTTNATPNNPITPIPELDFDFESDITVTIFDLY